MSCPCTTSTLRLFVKSLTRIDLHTTHQTQQLRSCLRSQNAISSSLSFPKTRCLSSLSKSTSKHGRKDSDSISLKDGSRSRSISSVRLTSTTSNEREEGHAAIMEITADAIDALAAESYNELSQATQRSEGHSLETSPTDYGDDGRRSCRFLRAESIQPRPYQRTSQVERKQSANTHFERPWIDNKVKERPPASQRDREYWQIQKAALKEKFGDEPWNPRKKLSPDALTGIRAIHAQFPQEYTTSVLAEKFQVSPEVIRRILKSKWQPSADEEIDRQTRWFNRGAKVWERWSEEGKKPPKRWREAGVQRGPGIGDKKRIMKARGIEGNPKNWRPQTEDVVEVLTTERKSLIPKGQGPTSFV